MMDKNTLLRIEPEIKKLEKDLKSLTEIVQYTRAQIETMTESGDETFMPDIYELYNKGEKHLYRIITQMNVFYNAVDLYDPSKKRQLNYDCRICIGSEYICIRVPMFSSRNRTILRPNYPYEDALRQALTKHSFPQFDKKVFIAANVYPGSTSDKHMSDPDNLDSKRAIDLVAAFVRGDDAADSLYEAMSFKTDDIPEGGYIIVSKCLLEKDMAAKLLKDCFRKNQPKIS